MKTFQIILNAITTFFIIGCGAVVVAFTASGGSVPNTASLIVCVLTGLAAAAKETRSFIGLPPLSNGNYQAIAQLVKDGNARQDETDLSNKPKL